MTLSQRFALVMRQKGRTLLEITAVCFVIGFLPYLTGTQKHIAWAIVSWLSGPAIVLALNMISVAPPSLHVRRHADGSIRVRRVRPEDLN